MIKKITHFPLWWYKDSLLWFKRFFKNLLIFLDNRFAVSLMCQKLFTPLFHDASLLGRILSLIFRLVRIITGSIVITLAVIAMEFWFVVWLIFPYIFILLFKQIGAGILICVWLIDGFKQSRKSYLNKEILGLIKKSGSNSEKLKSLLVQTPSVRKVLIRLEITPETINNLPAIIDIQEWLNKAIKLGENLKLKQIGGEWLLLALLQQENWRFPEALETLKWLKKEKKWNKTPFIWEEDYQSRPIGGVDRALTGIPTPTLDKFSTDLTKLALKKQLPEMFCKQEVVDQLTEILSRRKQNNVLVIGEPGSGKTTLVKSMAQEIVRGVKAQSLRFKRLIALDASRLAAGANGAELHQRMNQIIAEIKAAENIILFVDEVHNLASINKNSAETSDIFMALEPALSDGAFQFIGATTTENYKKYLEPNEAFARLFEVVELENGDKPQAVQILEYLAWQREQIEKVTITFLALQAIVDLSDKLIHDRVLPDKAVNLLDEIVAVIKAQDKELITIADVEKLISKKTKVPVTQLTQQETTLLLNLEKTLHQRVIGQDKAIKAIADAVRRARTGLKSNNKPIASFLFCGPTGVGKTETAKTLAQEFFGSERVMIRLDMSEYQTTESVDRLLELLTDAVRHQPYTLVLLDEIEKAHSKIINLFLQVLDDARLTDLSGKTADFSNTIIIATTNAGTTIEEIETHFLPEFLNRFSGLIMFQTLNKNEVEEVIKLKLKTLSQELAKQEFIINFNQNLVKDLAKNSFSNKWGGRQIERTMQEKITNIIAQKILQGEIKKREAFNF